ncbi:hypothetical protein [Asanoa siamensis]|uniref:Uncharacterized protein n=1 Tax=Asanoa siamensis TaxID=926357 RepID=A0ABQ4D398_9ACTN|nr:hypothetical protein [Asanoa siamensis]GIF77979.1 hypothetical protein Asi02nite_74970 [Asanoa siamensis]
MSSVLPVLLLGVAGILCGGVYSLHKQGASRGVVGFVGLLAVLALVGGVLWLAP